MGNPTRLKGGVSVHTVGKPLGNFPLPDANYICQYQNDFHTYVAGDWTVTSGGAGSGVALSTTVAGGQAVITTATSGTESILLASPSFRFKAGTSTTVGEDTWFKARVTLDATVAQPDYAIGLCKGTPSTFNGATDGVWFTKATTATVWSLVMKAAAGTTTTIALPASTVPGASQVVDLAYYFDGSDNTLYVWHNDVFLGTVNADYGSLGTVMTGIPASTILVAPFASNSFHTGTSLLTVDYLTAGGTLGR